MSILIKVCPKCGKDRKVRKRVRKNRNHLESYCPACNKLKLDAYLKANKEKIKAYRLTISKDTLKNIQLQYAFGITINDYNDMLTKQDRACAICKRAASLFKRALAVDHSHETGKVRALLCGGCNTALGHLKEDFTVAINMAKYIQEHNGVEI